MPTEQTIAVSATSPVRLTSAVTRIALKNLASTGPITCRRLAEVGATHRIYLVIERLSADSPPGTSFDVSICSTKQQPANAGTLNFYDVRPKAGAVTFDVSAIFESAKGFSTQQVANVLISAQSAPFGDAKPRIGRIRIVATRRS